MSAMNASRAHFALCAPDQFDVVYRINPWMDPGIWERDRGDYAALAKAQWQGLRAKLTELGARTDFVSGVKGLPDMVFTANAGVVLGRSVILPRFKHPERQGETKHFADFFESLRARGLVDRIYEMPDHVDFEGAGDCLWDEKRQMFWMGWGPRSSRAAADFVESVFEKPVVALELVDPRFYHLDTCLRPLSNGHILYFPAAFSEEGRRRIAEIAGGAAYLIPVEDVDACRFAVNAAHFDTHVILSVASAPLRRALEDKGYLVHETPLWAFHTSGGSALCLTLRLDQAAAGAATSAAILTPSAA